MKKAIALILALLLVLAMTACDSSKNNPTPTEAPAPAAASTPTAAPAPTNAPANTEAPATTEAPTPTDAPAPTEAPKPTDAPKPTEAPDPSYGLINLYIPADFVGDMTEEEMREFAEEEGIEDVYPQEDGGVVYVMTEETHEKLLRELSGEIEDALQSITEGEDALPSLRSVNHNEDYSVFEFIIDRDAEDGSESLYALSLTLYGAYFQAYSGAAEPNCVVELKDAATGEVFDSVSYQDWLDFINGFGDWGDDWGDDWGSDSNLQTPELKSEVVLLDDAGITVTATGFTNEWFGLVLNIHIVNSSDQLAYVSCDRFIVNGYCADAFLYTEVQPGGEADDTLSIYDASLDLLGTEYIGELEVQLYVNDEEYNRVCTGDIITIQTSDYDKDWERIPEGEIIFSEEGVTVSFLCTMANSYWESTDVYLMVENASGKTVGVDCTDLLVNGAELFPWYYETVYPGCKAISSLSIDLSELEGSDSDTVDTVEIALTIYDEDTYEEITKTLGFISLPIDDGGQG